jgi:riboflavin kinase/FMN adenylyltransferase
MTAFDAATPLPPALRGGVIALGNFDGFHLGHQAVVGEAVRQAKARSVPALVATFDPHPVRLFRPETPPFRLTTLDQRARLFTEAGADAMVVFHFNTELAGVSAQDFVTDWLITRAGASGIVTGEDFTFGKGRGGNINVLREIGGAHGLSTSAIAPVCDNEGPISSSRIREALLAGDCATATRLLTRPFTIAGTVEHGAKLGRSIGFPTANLQLGTYLRPRYGIYAVTGELADGRTLAGAANIGIRPSFDPPLELLEPNFFDFDEDLYGQQIAVALHAFLRPEAKYDNLEALTAQIGKDCDAARRFLNAGLT